MCGSKAEASPRDPAQAPGSCQGIPSAMGLLQMEGPDIAWESWPLHLTCLSSQQSQEQENDLAEGEL